MKRIPIREAREFAGRHGMTQVAIVAWDGRTGVTHVITYGRSLKDCEQAAVLGNRIKKEILRWPDELCHAVPARARRASRKVSA